MNINIPEDKEKAIYEAALDEFALRGYINGSTNTIVKNAGISKGALFNYFGNKLNLYLYVADRAMETVEKEILNNMESLSSDFFERLVQGSNARLQASIKYKRESSIIIDCYGCEDKDIIKYMEEKMTYYTGLGSDIYLKDIDYSKFKENIDINKVYEMFIYICDGLNKKNVKKYGETLDTFLENKDMMYEEVFSYINIIKESIYK